MRRITLIGLALLGLGACSPRGSTIDYRLVAMATTLDLTLPSSAIEQHPDLIGKLESELGVFERDYYAWADGELRELNLSLSATGAFEASPGMAALLERAREIALASDGAFDPGVGKLVELWGFNDAREEPTRPPTDAAIESGLAVAGSLLDVRIDGTRLTGPIAEYTLDLGGIAKGAAVDRIIGELESLAIAPALVNAGGDLRVTGEPEDRAWRIGIQAPRGGALLGTIELHDGEAAFSSGDYERYFDLNGQRLHHILDPRTGRPALHTQAITVIAGDGTTADAAATALFVAGPDRWQGLAASLDVALVLRVDADGSVEMTAGMRDRFQPANGNRSDIIAASD